jgi:hypothetical protein
MQVARRSRLARLVVALGGARVAKDDGATDERDNPARKVDKPRRLPSTRRAVVGTRPAGINQAAATTAMTPSSTR